MMYRICADLKFNHVGQRLDPTHVQIILDKIHDSLIHAFGGYTAVEEHGYYHAGQRLDLLRVQIMLDNFAGLTTKAGYRAYYVMSGLYSLDMVTTLVTELQADLDRDSSLAITCQATPETMQK